MRLLVNSDALLPLGGVELSTLQVSERLRSLGHDPHLLYVQDGDLRGQWAAIAGSMRQVRGFTVDVTRPWRTLHHLPGAVRAGIAAAPEVIYLNRAEQMLWAALVSRRTGAPIVCHLRHHPHNRLAVRLLSRAASGYAAVSEAIKQEWVDAGVDGAAITVVPNGVDVNLYTRPTPDERLQARRTLSLAPDAHVTLYYGRVTQDKGVCVLLDAWRQLPSSPTDVLLVVGEADPGTGAMFDISGLAGVHRMERQDDVLTLLHASDLVVLPASWQEPFGRVVIEAMSAGVPVIATRVGGIPDILTGSFARQLVKPGDSGSLASKLSEFHDWRTDMPELGTAGRDHVAAHFSLDRTVRGVEAALLRALEGARSTEPHARKVRPRTSTGWSNRAVRVSRPLSKPSAVRSALHHRPPDAVNQRTGAEDHDIMPDISTRKVV